MISALVIYLGGNDAGSGFYKLAQDLGWLPPGVLSSRVKEEFWVGQVKALHAHYQRAQRSMYLTQMAPEEGE